MNSTPWLTADTLDEAIKTLVRETGYPFPKMQMTRLDWGKQLTVSVDTIAPHPADHLDGFPGASFFKIRIDGDHALIPEIFAHDGNGRLIGVLTQVDPWDTVDDLTLHLQERIYRSTLDEYHRTMLSIALRPRIKRYFKAKTRRERNRILNDLYKRIPV